MAKWPFAAGFVPSAPGFRRGSMAAAGSRTTSAPGGVITGWVCHADDNELRWQNRSSRARLKVGPYLFAISPRVLMGSRLGRALPSDAHSPAGFAGSGSPSRWCGLVRCCRNKESGEIHRSAGED